MEIIVNTNFINTEFCTDVPYSPFKYMVAEFLIELKNAAFKSSYKSTSNFSSTFSNIRQTFLKPK